MRLAALSLALLFSLCIINAFELAQSREEMLSYYYANLEGKVPKTARALFGDERVNVAIGGRTIGLETKGGQLYTFELYAVEKPTIEITVSDGAAEKISQGKLGVMQAIDSGGIKIKPNSLFSALKVEMMKRIYAASGVDDQILGKKKVRAESPGSSASLYLQKVRISG